jgi:hypothetical protein
VSGASSDHFRKCHTTNKKEQPHGVQRTNERKTAVLKHYRFSLRPTTRIHTLTRLPPPHYLFPLSVVSARSLLCRWSDLRRLALEGNLCESRSLVTSLRNTRCIPKRSGSLRVLSLNCVSCLSPRAWIRIKHTRHATPQLVQEIRSFGALATHCVNEQTQRHATGALSQAPCPVRLRNPPPRTSRLGNLHWGRQHAHREIINHFVLNDI